MKAILDVCCGSRMFWFNKNHPRTIYCDCREEVHIKRFGSNNAERHLEIRPDIVCDFRNLPFDDNQFSLVVFDPPHLLNMRENAWFKKAYGSLGDDWEAVLGNGFKECMRVLKPNGVLIFKWAETDIPLRRILNVFGEDPLIGHKSGKKANTHWVCFMKPDTPVYEPEQMSLM